MQPADASTKWVDPTSALSRSGDGILSAAQIESWRTRGFALVDGVIPQELLKRVIRDADAEFPAADSEEAASIADFGSRGHFVFPARSAAANEITLHPRLLGAVAELLDVPVRQLRLSQSDLWAKYGRDKKTAGRWDNQDQRIHVDYPNHTLTHPPRWDEPEAVEIILYLSDVEVCGGATAVVPRNGRDDPAYPWPIVHSPGIGTLPYINDRESAEAFLSEEAPELAAFRAEHLYPRECRARYRVGSVLFYRHDTWHRGTPMRLGARRLVHNLTFRRAGHEWVSTLHTGWAWSMYHLGQPMEKLIAALGVDQRCVLGFPAPGHPYWTRATLDAVGARYGPHGFEMSPYEAELAVATDLSVDRSMPTP
jgi:hypothetical protein